MPCIAFVMIVNSDMPWKDRLCTSSLRIVAFMRGLS